MNHQTKTHTAETLAEEGLLSGSQLDAIRQYYRDKLFSIHHELRTLLYLGVSLFTGGVGILVYKNIDTIGHQAIIAFLILICAGSFYYVYKNSPPFSLDERSENRLFSDYILLLGALLFVILEGYLQYQYGIFGNRYNIASLIPSVLFFYLAYRFDHKGILSMAIGGLAGFLGLTATPVDLFVSGAFSSINLIMTGIAFSLILGALAFTLSYLGIKRHFTFTYYNFAANIAFVSSLAGLFQFDMNILFVAIIAIIAWATYRYSVSEKSLYFLLVTVLYSYITVTYLFFHFLLNISGDDVEGIIIVGFFYFIGSSIGVVLLFKNYKGILGIEK